MTGDWRLVFVEDRPHTALRLVEAFDDQTLPDLDRGVVAVEEEVIHSRPGHATPGQSGVAEPEVTTDRPRVLAPVRGQQIEEERPEVDVTCFIGEVGVLAGPDLPGDPNVGRPGEPVV